MEQNNVMQRLVETPLFRRLVELRDTQISQNVRRFCEDPKFKGMWTDEVFNYRPSSMIRGRKDQWDEIKKEASFYLNKLPKEAYYVYEEHERMNLIGTPEGELLKSMLGGMFSKQGPMMLKRLLNNSVLERKSVDAWKEEFAACKEQSSMYEQAYKALSRDEQAAINTGFSKLALDNNGNYKYVYVGAPKQTEAAIEAAQRYEESTYYGGKSRKHRKHHKRAHKKTRHAKTGGKKSRKHHKKSHRKTHRN